MLVVTRGEKHRELARQMGAYWVGEGVDSLPEKVDSAIIFAPVGGILPQALSALKRGGTVSLADPLQDANIALQDLKNDRINGTGVLII
jgi:propanol-preferring alcohol dehydrogenase